MGKRKERCFMCGVERPGYVVAAVVVRRMGEDSRPASVCWHCKRKLEVEDGGSVVVEGKRYTVNLVKGSET